MDLDGKKGLARDISQYGFHRHNGYAWDVYDAQGIFLTRVCDVCEQEKLAIYRPEILSGYSQADVDEQIEES